MMKNPIKSFPKNFLQRTDFNTNLTLHWYSMEKKFRKNPAEHPDCLSKQVVTPVIGLGGKKGRARVLHEKEFEVLAVWVDLYIFY